MSEYDFYFISLMKYTFYHFIRSNKSHIRSKSLNILNSLHFSEDILKAKTLKGKLVRLV